MRARSGPIKAGASTDGLPVIGPVRHVEALRGISREDLPVDPPGGLGRQRAAVPEAAGAQFLSSEPNLHHCALSLAGRLGDNIDDPVYGVCAPEGRPRASDHLNPGYIVEFDILGLPEYPREHGVVHATPIDQNQEFVREKPGKAA